jgi:hypothetical protein
VSAGAKQEYMDDLGKRIFISTRGMKKETKTDGMALPPCRVRKEVLLKKTFSIVLCCSLYFVCLMQWLKTFIPK